MVLARLILSDVSLCAYYVNCMLSAHFGIYGFGDVWGVGEL